MPSSGPSAELHYTGADNLEIMAEAVNYNAFLGGLILTQCRGAHRVLDFGAGSGTFAEWVRNQGHNVTCLEPDPEQAEYLRTRGFETFQLSGELDDSAFDTIYTLNVLEHIADDAAEVRHLFRILRPGGTIIAYVPAFKILFGAMDRKVGHYRRYTRESLAQIFENAGFEIERNLYADSLGFLATLTFNLVGQSDGTLNRRALIFYDRFIFPVSRVLDRAVSRIFGKNVYAVLRRPEG